MTARASHSRRASALESVQLRCAGRRVPRLSVYQAAVGFTELREGSSSRPRGRLGADRHSARIRHRVPLFRGHPGRGPELTASASATRSSQHARRPAGALRKKQSPNERSPPSDGGPGAGPLRRPTTRKRGYARRKTHDTSISARRATALFRVFGHGRCPCAGSAATHLSRSCFSLIRAVFHLSVGPGVS